MQKNAFLQMLLFTVATLLPLSVPAQSQPDETGMMMLAPPPGPYVSSRPDLDSRPLSQQGGNRMPLIGNLPRMNEPMRYMPSPRQMPAPPPWWYRPYGR